MIYVFGRDILMDEIDGEKKYAPTNYLDVILSNELNSFDFTEYCNFNPHVH